MYGDLLYTPTHSRQPYNSNRKERSMTFSQLNKSHKSTEIGSASPYRSGAVSRLEQAKKTIDSVIYDIEDQQSMNQSAFREVKGVNNDILEEFRRSLHEEKENASTHVPDFKSQASAYNLRTYSPYEDPSSLRTQLNEEMKKNSNLLLKLSRM